MSYYSVSLQSIIIPTQLGRFEYMTEWEVDDVQLASYGRAYSEEPTYDIVNGRVVVIGWSIRCIENSLDCSAIYAQAYINQ